MRTATQLIPAIEMYQGTATGGKNAERDTTIFHLVEDDCWVHAVEESVLGDRDSYGQVHVNHPAIMLGAWEEVSNDMRLTVEEALYDAGVIFIAAADHFYRIAPQYRLSHVE